MTVNQIMPSALCTTASLLATAMRWPVPDNPTPAPPAVEPRQSSGSAIWEDVSVNSLAARAIEIAAAGRHNLAITPMPDGRFNGAEMRNIMRNAPDDQRERLDAHIAACGGDPCGIDAAKVEAAKVMDAWQLTRSHMASERQHSETSTVHIYVHPRPWLDVISRAPQEPFATMLDRARTAALRRHTVQTHMDDAAENLLRQATIAMNMTDDDHRQTVEIARTIAAAAGCDWLGRIHIAEALCYRPKIKLP